MTLDQIQDALLAYAEILESRAIVAGALYIAVSTVLAAVDAELSSPDRPELQPAPKFVDPFAGMNLAVGPDGVLGIPGLA